MNYNFLLQLIFSFSIFLGSAKVNNVGKQHSIAIAIPIQTTLPADADNRQHDSSTIWLLLSFLSDGDSNGHHEHENAKLHYLNFERIRRRPCGFSIRCAFVKLLLSILYASILLLLICQFLHALQTAG